MHCARRGWAQHTDGTAFEPVIKPPASGL